MIRNVHNVANKNSIRHLSNSQENIQLKKSSSASSKNAGNLSTLGFSGMTNSIKGRVDTSNSNKKKNLLNTSNSNKSLKALRENNKATNVASSTATYKKRSDKENKQIKDEKKGTIMVKSIKSKIVGNGFNTSKADKQNNFKKKQQTQYNQNTVINSINTHINTETSIKTPRTPRDKFKNQTFMSLSLINKRDQEKLPATLDLTLDMFELGHKLGKGRFGDVYMARQIRSGFALAIKVINKKEVKQSEMENQLIQQIKIQMYSNHPNVLKMYGFFSDKNKIYLLLELATNRCLFKQIRQKAYFSQDLACYYFRQVASGIRYLHSNYVIHRDIKPENILNCFNVLKICDFGWATYSPIYQRQTFCGTLDYVPPEIVTGEFYDEKADVWCLGVLCYQLCTGKAPFQSKTDENQTYDKILKVQVQFPIYLSQKVVDFIGKILNRDPQKRINLQEIQTHEWMRAYENEPGRMICKQIWDNWMKFSK